MSKTEGILNETETNKPKLQNKTKKKQNVQLTLSPSSEKQSKNNKTLYESAIRRRGCGINCECE